MPYLNEKYIEVGLTFINIKAQVGVFLREMNSEGIPIIGLAKRFETLVIPKKELGFVKLAEFRLPKGPALNLVQRLRNEAHRFARRYHHELISKEIRFPK